LSEVKKDVTKETNDDVDSVLSELEPLAKVVAPCLECTTCASACPVFQSDSDRNPRRLINRLGRREFEGLLDEVDFWWCGACYSCEAHCPQGVPLAHVFFRLKNLAFQTGKPIPKLILRTGETLRSGFLIPVKKEITEKRHALGLPDPVCPDTNEIETLLDATGFSARITQSRKLY